MPHPIGQKGQLVKRSLDPKSQVPDPQSQIPNHMSQIPNPNSESQIAIPEKFGFKIIIVGFRLLIKQKMFSKKDLIPLQKKYGQKNYWLKIILADEKFWLKKKLIQKMLVGKKNVGREKKVGQNKIGVEKKSLG